MCCSLAGRNERGSGGFWLLTAPINACALTFAQDAARLAMKVVATYGLSDAGITVYAPPGEPPGFGRKSFEVAIDNIDADLFGRAARVRRRDWSGLQACAAVPGGSSLHTKLC